MSNKSKQQQPSTSALTEPPPPPFSNPFDDIHLRENEEQEVWDTSIQFNSTDVTDIYPVLIGNMDQTKRYLFEIANHMRSTIDLRPDGRIVVTPHPRHLPNQVVKWILTHLAEDRETLIACTLVTKQFYLLAHPLLWQLGITIHDSDTFEQFLTSISAPPQYYSPYQQTLGHSIRRFCLHDAHWTDDKLVRLLPHLPRLNYLTINTSHITDRGFQHVPVQCQHLATLCLAHTRLAQASFEAIGRHCQHLIHLDWYISRQQSPAWLALILKGCRLQRLRMTSDVVHLSPTEISIIQNFDQLKIMAIHIMPSNSVLASLLTRTTCWPQLTCLTLCPCSDIDDPLLLGFIKTHPHLVQLDLTFAGQLTDAILHHIGVWLPHLTHLGIVGNKNLTARNIRQFVQHSVCLASVKLFSCHRNIGNQFTESTLSFATAVNLDRKEIQAIKLAKNGTV